MRRIAIAGAFSLALTLGACAAKQPPAPPPLNLVTEAVFFEHLLNLGWLFGKDLIRSWQSRRRFRQRNH